MKKLLLIGLMLATAGCEASPDDTNSISQLEAEIAQKEAALERAKVSGGYPNATPSAMCVYGVLYYVSVTYGGSRVYSVAISPKDKLPQLCNQATRGIPE